ncbi:polyprenyl synthetase family protein [Gorillibacterium massiliense]|uniref:polyprenyl synthetase family protein n=1 Tax=Gorillibacterium massiliense TaxID=1280390 RepID=UPI0004AFCCA6|nr:polyprenyl synthetase family protein [Gorillibacterium massiliense]
MQLHEALSIDLADLNQTLLNIIESDQDLPKPSDIHSGIIRLIEAGGKRLRPIMAITGGRFGPANNPDKVMRIAAMLEYIHMASLIHDDIIDDSDLRRNVPALHKSVGVNHAIFIANYLMARVVEWATTGEDVDSAFSALCASLASLATQLCVGEYQQLENRFNFNLTLDEYLEKTRSKTALLMAKCLEAGAQCNEADEKIKRILYEFGDALGISFQIRDDVLDYTQTSEAIGKPAGNDLRNGNVTLPVLYALEDPALAADILMLNAESSDEEFAAIVVSIKSCGAIERTLALSESYLAKARSYIAELKEYPAYKDLEILLAFFSQG